LQWRVVSHAEGAWLLSPSLVKNAPVSAENATP
jgi:hypothetical protein